MESPEHRVREVTKHVRYRAFATLFTVALSKLGRDGRPAKWLVSEGVHPYPNMELNVSSPFQRRMFYFPRAYWERLMGLPFGQYIEQTLEKGQVFLDIGANIGFYSLFAASRVGPEGRVFSFEPDPMTFESLKRSLARNGFGWARPINVALSNRAGEIPFYTVTDGSAHSLVPEIEKRAHRYSGKTPVRVARLDDLLAEGVLDTPRVDLLKIDVEGEEERTVGGLLGTLEHFRFPRVWAEVRGPRGSTRAPNTYPGVERQLTALGYRPLQWKRGELRRVVTSDIQGREDVLFEKP